MSTRHQLQKFLRTGIPPLTTHVSIQVPHDLPIGPDDFSDGVRRRAVGQPGGRHGADPACRKFVGVEKIADQGLLVVGLVFDVGEDEDAVLTGEGLWCGHFREKDWQTMMTADDVRRELDGRS